MAELSCEEYERAPAYLRTQLRGVALERVNDAVAAINECATDKRFEHASQRGDVSLAVDEVLAALRGLGSRAKPLIDLLVHCGRLGQVRSKRDSGGVRYRVVR